MDTLTAPDEVDAASGPAGAPRVHLCGVTPEALAALPDVTFTDDAAEADLVVVSTRIPRSGLGGLLSRLRGTARCPMVALTHTGGEPVAVEIMRAGGTSIIAEGNEAALAAFVTGAAPDGGLVATYDRRMGGRRDGDAADQGLDAATNLPSAAAFEQRIEELSQAGTIPRIAFVRIRNLEPAARRLAAEATAVLRRRLAVQYRELTRAEGAELFVLDRSDFAVVGSGLSPNRAEELGRQLSCITEAFAPNGNTPLKLAIGHAGPEVTDEMATLRELAQRALGVAAEQPASAVVGADSLSLGLASTTELEAAMRTLELAERSDRHQPGHGARVARLASELAWHLGFEPAERALIRLAAHFHDIGKVGLAPEVAAADPASLGDADLSAYRAHAARGAAYLRPLAGGDIAAAVASHHERWDGSGFPDGLAGEDIPVGARLIALADAFDAARHPAAGTRQPVGESLRMLGDGAGTRFDPGLVEPAIALFARLSAEAEL